MFTKKETDEIAMEIRKTSLGCENIGEDEALFDLVENLISYFESKKVKDFEKAHFATIALWNMLDSDARNSRKEVIKKYKDAEKGILS